MLLTSLGPLQRNCHIGEKFLAGGLQLNVILKRKDELWERCNLFVLLALLLRVHQDHCTFLGNCTPTPPLSQHFALSEK